MLKRKIISKLEDWKKETRYKYKIVNTNDVIKEDSVRVIQAI